MEYGKANCKFCGKEFNKVRANHSFCTPECASAYRDKERNKREYNTDRAKYTIYHRDKFRCIYCGKTSYEDNIRLHIDHIIPYAYSRNNTIHNLVTACEDCNIGKNVQPLEPDIFIRIRDEVAKRNKQLGFEDIEFTNNEMNQYFEKLKNGNNNNQ